MIGIQLHYNLWDHFPTCVCTECNVIMWPTTVCLIGGTSNSLSRLILQQPKNMDDSRLTVEESDSELLSCPSYSQGLSPGIQDNCFLFLWDCHFLFFRKQMTKTFASKSFYEINNVGRENARSYDTVSATQCVVIKELESHSSIWIKHRG